MINQGAAHGRCTNNKWEVRFNDLVSEVIVKRLTDRTQSQIWVGCELGAIKLKTAFNAV